VSPKQEFSNTELILLAILLAGGAEHYADIEDVALMAFQVSAQRFGWRSQPYPSDKIVGQAFADLEGRHGDQLTRRGSGKVATRMLTAEGLRTSLEVADRLAGKHFADVNEVLAYFSKSDSNIDSPSASAERRPVQGELLALHRHLAFQRWSNQDEALENIEDWQLADALSCLPDAPSWALKNQLAKLEALAERWQDVEAARFLKDLTGKLLPESRVVVRTEGSGQ
jgi:hypothetical protein